MTPYLPEAWFSKNIALFFSAEPQSSHSSKDLGLEEGDTAANCMAKLMMR